MIKIKKFFYSALIALAAAQILLLPGCFSQKKAAPLAAGPVLGSSSEKVVEGLMEYDQIYNSSEFKGALTKKQTAPSRPLEALEFDFPIKPTILSQALRLKSRGEVSILKTLTLLCEGLNWRLKLEAGAIDPNLSFFISEQNGSFFEILVFLQARLKEKNLYLKVDCFNNILTLAQE